MNIKQKPRLSHDLIESIMLNRGIDNIQLYLNPTNENDTDLSQIPFINEAIELIKKNIGKEILILVDSDAEGITSAAKIYKYLKYVNPFAKIRYFIHEHKTHGLTPQFMEHVEDTKPDLIIVPDAGTNDIEQREKIISLGIDLLIIDHHNADKHTSNGGILINNQCDDNMNKNMTGAGMTYLVCKAMDKFAFNTGRIESLKDLAMIGIIGDCASLFENETRYLCMKALRNIESKMIRTVVEENKQDLDTVTFTNMQFGGIIPLINSVVRIGTPEEKELMFKALADIETDYFKIIEKRKLNKETRKYEKVPFKFNIYQLAIDAARGCRDRQNKIINNELKFADEQFNPNAGIQIYIVQTDECKPLTGLLANKLTSLWQQPVIVVWDLNGAYTGSLRGWEKSIPNLKKWCEETQLFRLVQGHDNAAGVVFELDNLEKIKKCTENVEYKEYSIEVDNIYESCASVSDIYLINNNKELFRNGVVPPLFAVKNLLVTPQNAKWSKNTLRINIDGVTYIKFKVPEEEYTALIETPNCKINVVGTFDVNEWNGRQFPQMQIEEYEVIYNEPSVIYFGIFA